MGATTFIRVTDPVWRFDPEDVFAALRNAYAGRSFWQGDDRRQLMAEGYAHGWEVNLNEEGTAFVIKAPPAPLMELVAWVRGYVPEEVTLQIFDDQLTFDVAPLRPGITPEQVRAEFYPDAWRVEQMSAKEPPTIEEQMRADKPPHLP